MSRSKLLILDANLVIRLHELGHWTAVIERYEVRLARTVVEESKYFEKDGQRIDLDLIGDIDASKITVFDVEVSDTRRFLAKFDRTYAEKLDAGELESLVHLDGSGDDLCLASGDAIVYKVLGLLNRAEQGISLEEALQRVGLSVAGLPWLCMKAFREKYTTEGQQDFIRGRGLRK